MKVPTPEGLSWEVHFMFWAGLIVIGLLFSLCIYLLKKYIDKNDSIHAKVDDRLLQQSASTKEVTNRIEREAGRIDQASAQMVKSQAEFQSNITKELLEIHKGTVAIKTELIESKSFVGDIKKELQTITGTLEAHQKSLSLGAQAMAKQREEVANLKTTVTRLGEDVVLIQQRATKKGG